MIAGKQGSDPSHPQMKSISQPMQPKMAIISTIPDRLLQIAGESKREQGRGIVGSVFENQAYSFLYVCFSIDRKIRSKACGPRSPRRPSYEA